MGTLGGNLCLDTRCNYYDQNYEWRKAIDFCMKKDGETCWVAHVEPEVPGRVVDRHRAGAAGARRRRSRSCRAGGDARDRARGSLSQRRHPLPHARGRTKILTAVHLPAARRLAQHVLEAAPPRRVRLSRCCRWRPPRRFAADGTVEAARIVLGAVASVRSTRPAAAALLVGQPLTDEAIAHAADAAAQPAKPMDNTDFSLVLAQARHCAIS